MTPSDPAFWEACDELVLSSRVVIDRPRGEPHPRRPELVYPLDYGYLEGTTAGDGQGIDVWLGGGAGKAVTAIVCTVDLFKRDAELKLLVRCSDADIELVHRFLAVTTGLPCLVLRRPASRNR
jgi:inorganic pyrophosphatase